MDSPRPIRSAAFGYAVLADARAAQLQAQQGQVAANIRKLQSSIREMQNRIAEYEGRLEDARQSEADIKTSLAQAISRVEDEWIERAEQLGHKLIDDASFAILWTTQSENFLIKIFKHLDLPGISLVSRVCKGFKRAVTQEEVWLGLVGRHFPLASPSLERSRPTIFINWMDYFRWRTAHQKQLTRDFGRQMRTMRLMPAQDGIDPNKPESILSFVQTKAIEALMESRKFDFDTLFAFSIDLAFELPQPDVVATTKVPLKAMKTSSCSSYLNYGETLFAWASEVANPLQKRALLQAAVEKFRSAITQASEGLGALKSTASESAAVKYEIAATRWAAAVDLDAEALQLQRTQPLQTVAKLMHSIGLEVTSVFELEPDDEIAAALSRVSSVSSIDSWTSRSGESSVSNSGTTTPQFMDEEDAEILGSERPSLRRSRGSRGSLTAISKNKKPHPLNKARSDLSNSQEIKLEPFQAPTSSSRRDQAALASSVSQKLMESSRPAKLEPVPSLARPSPFFRALTVGAATVSASSPPTTSNPIADFKNSRAAPSGADAAGSTSPSQPKRPAFKRSKTRPELLQQDASFKLFTAGSASILARESSEPISPVSPRHRSIEIVQNQTAALESPGAPSVRFTSRASPSASTILSQQGELDINFEIPTPASSPERSPPASGTQTPESAMIGSSMTGGLSADALSEAAMRLSRQSSATSLVGRRSRSNSQSSISDSRRKSYPAVERLNRASSLNTIDTGVLKYSSSKDTSSTQCGASSSSTMGRLNRVQSDASIKEAIVAVKGFVGVALKLAHALYELSQVPAAPATNESSNESDLQLREASVLCWRIHRLLDVLPELKRMLANVESGAVIEIRFPLTGYSSCFDYLKAVSLLHSAISNARAIQIAKSPFQENSLAAAVGGTALASCRTPLSDALVAHALRCIDESIDDTRDLASLHLALEAGLTCAVWSEEARCRYYLCRMLQKLPIVHSAATAPALHVNYEAFGRFLHRGWFKKIAHDIRQIRGLDDEIVPQPVVAGRVELAPKNEKTSPIMRPRASSEQLTNRRIVRTVRSKSTLLCRENSSNEIAQVPPV